MLMLEKEQLFEEFTPSEAGIDYCPACGCIIADNDYFYSRIPTVTGCICSQCGFSQYFLANDEL